MGGSTELYESIVGGVCGRGRGLTSVDLVGADAMSRSPVKAAVVGCSCCVVVTVADQPILCRRWSRGRAPRRRIRDGPGDSRCRRDDTTCAAALLIPCVCGGA